MTEARPCVLFVDDEEPNLIVWETAAAKKFPVKVARSGEDALAIMRETEVAVVLADQRMPRMTGVELLEKVRHLYPETVRILITAYSDLDAAVDAINRGHVRRYLRKPCPLPELFGEIAEALDVHDLRARVRLLERRVLLTERVYALGVIAAGLGRELERPAVWIKESVMVARTELAAIATKLEAEGADVRVLRVRLAELHEGLSRAITGVDRVLAIAESISVPRGQTTADGADLADVIRLVLRVARGEFRERVHVELDVQPASRVRGGPAQLAQVALSLLIHAFEAVGQRQEPGGLITIRLRQEGSTVRFEVVDNGPRLPDAVVSNLFDPLRASREQWTSGLGLAVARRIVEELGGHLDVASGAQGGTVFRADLPINAG